MKNQKNFRYLKNIALLLILILVVSLTSTGCGTRYVLSTGFKDNELFRIDKTSCTKAEYLIYLTNTQNQYSSAYGSEIWNQRIGEQSLEEDLMQTILARVVKVKMMTLLAASYEIELSEFEKENASKAAQQYYSTLSEAEILAFDNVTIEDIQKMYEDYALAYKVYDYLTKDINLEISDDEARSVVLKQIVIPYASEIEKAEALQKAAEAYTALNAGKDFDVAIDEYSDCPNDATISIRKGQTESSIENAVFNLSEGQYSSVVEGNDAVYIFFCVSAYDMAEVENVKQQMLQEYKQETFDSVYNVFANEKECFLNEDLWTNISPVNSGETDTTEFYSIFNLYFGR